MSEIDPKIPYKRIKKVKEFSAILGLVIATPMFLWLFVGLIPAVPSIIDVFGIEGLRTPAGIIIAGLVLAAFGFEDT